ncbi:SusD/RagB family nutrient-binding outer membrane lipoprotein [Pricia sp. S334]|uniref:SusD/RagB family nutrient-binding outer membrane lipoprotein n=1 Tax=Pricia mediterranea TaxID=3076079 RepID=A0ABU3L3G9_9FLAO|nr:SusD/RagB family nutrient-binding outer membrane lipoprotein [Pricia sp. S334]MDT7828296.1 SusD/RagB family nutrient-binding outer membrane lipoprotein [Pricia sp. S334]
MNNTYRILRRITVVVVMVAVLLSCEKRIDDLYGNPNAVTVIDDAALFTKAVRSLFLETTGQSASRFSGHYGHYFVAGSTARIPDQYGDGFDQNYDQMFDDLYGGTIRHIEEVLEITSTGETQNAVRHAMADVIAVLGYAKITDAYGSVPYTQGGKGKTENILQPAYDSQENIYGDLIARLSSSISVLDNADPAMGYPGSDPIFDNDLGKWVRFANSVRLRLGMRLRFADNDLSKATVDQCLSAPLMETTGHDASIIETEGTGNPWFTNRTGFPSIKMSVRLIDQLQGTADPRLPVFVSRDGNGQYSGMVNGLDDTAFGNSDFATKSDIGIPLSSPNSKIYMITAAETWLLRAEAALAYDNDPVVANELYRKGIETALLQWEIDPIEIDAFLAAPIATLSGTNDEEQIGIQMWLALVPNYFEGWSQIRRTGYPVVPQRTAENLSQGVTNGFLPTRFLYSSFELSTNKAHVSEAIANQGPNTIDTPIWWDAK